MSRPTRYLALSGLAARVGITTSLSRAMVEVGTLTTDSVCSPCSLA